MDSTTITSIIIAIVAIVPGVWALVNQANKDKKQAELDLYTAAQTATNSIIVPLREEVARLHSEIAQLKSEIDELRKENSELVEANFEKDKQVQTLQYSLEGMKLRLDKFEGKEIPREETRPLKSTPKTKKGI